MAMRETVGSLRTYFVVFGVVATLGWFDDARTAVLTGLRMPLAGLLLSWLSVAVYVVTGPAFVVAGFKLKSALPTGAWWIKRLIMVSGVARILEAMLRALTQPSGLTTTEVTWELAAIAIYAYLFASVRRLAAEASGGLATATALDRTAAQLR